MMRRTLVNLLCATGLLACVQAHDASGRKQHALMVDAGGGTGGRVLAPTGPDAAVHEVTPPKSPKVGDRDLSYFEHAKQIIDDKCVQCHFDGGIAPMSLGSYDEVKPLGGLIKVVVQLGTMPPWRAVGPMNQHVGDRRLTASQKDTLVRWIDAGMKRGDANDAPQRATPPSSRSLTKVDLSLPLPSDYAPQLRPDDYHCFVLEWPYDQTKYVTALDIVPGNRALVHHAIVYHVTADGAEAIRERDAAEEGPGYGCFGGVSNASWLTSYEPGGYASEVPGGLGFEIEPGSVMVLQVHYNTLSADGTDRSRVDFTVEDEVDRTGRVMLAMNPLWYVGFMPIAANADNVQHSYLGRGLTPPDPAKRHEIFWVDLHMHALGKSGRIALVRANGVVEALLTIPDWDFAWQETYVLTEPVFLEPGDQLYVECVFDNTAANQLVVSGERLPSRDVNWGDGTTDEMCLGNVLIAAVE